METELIEHQTIASIVDNVEQAKAEVTQAFDLLLQAQKRLNAVLGNDGYYHHLFDGNNIGDYGLDKAAEASHKRITRNAWQYILVQTGLRQYMTAARSKELDEQLQKDQLPPLTLENIVGTLQGLHGRIDSLLMESVRDIFDTLRPRHSGLKTNQLWKVGRRVILTNWARSKFNGGFEPNYYDWCKWVELGNVFSLLDGKGVLKYPDDLKSQFREGMKDKRPGDLWENDYFRMRCYANDNVHIEFKRMDLVDKLNQIATNGELPGKEKS